MGGGDETWETCGGVGDEALRLVDALPPEVVMQALLEADSTGAALEALRVLVAAATATA